MTPVPESEHRRQIPYATTLALALHQTSPSRYPFLLESAASGTPQGRFDILFAFPGDSLALDANYRLTGPAAAGATDFLSALNGWWQHEHVELTPDALPFRGGWFLFLAYELATQVEPILGLAAEPGAPVALAVRVPCAVIMDHLLGQAWLVAESGAEDRLEQILADIDALGPDTDASPTGCLLSGELQRRSAGAVPRGYRPDAAVYLRRRYLPGQSVARMARPVGGWGHRPGPLPAAATQQPGTVRRTAMLGRYRGGQLLTRALCCSSVAASPRPGRSRAPDHAGLMRAPISVCRGS